GASVVRGRIAALGPGGAQAAGELRRRPGRGDQFMALVHLPRAVPCATGKAQVGAAGRGSLAAGQDLPGGRGPDRRHAGGLGGIATAVVESAIAPAAGGGPGAARAVWAAAAGGAGRADGADRRRAGRAADVAIGAD